MAGMREKVRKTKETKYRPSGFRAGTARYLHAAAILLAASLPLPAWGAASAEDMKAAVEDVLAAGDYQSELPLPKAANGEDSNPLSQPDWWRNEGDNQAPDRYRPAQETPEDSPFDLNLPPELMKVLRFLMWAVVFAGGALLIYYMVNESLIYLRWKKQARPEDAAGGAEGGPGLVRGAVLGDYEAMAARGDYGEAIHALLLHCIARMAERGAALSSAMTSREILRRLKLEQEEREALSVLVRMTELTHFGGRDASEEDFLKCRDLFRGIAAGGTA